MKIAIAGTGYVGLSNAVLLAQHNEVVAVDIVQNKIDLINNKKSPIVDKEIEEYLQNKKLNLTATTDAEKAYSKADYIIISTPTNYDPDKNYFDTSSIEAVLEIIAKVNNNEAVEVDEWFTEVFNKSMEVSRNSDGVFDITCAPLVNLWGFGFNKKDSVTPAMIDSLKTFVGYRKVHLEGKKVVKDDPRLLLNCSAIAKGYSCDVIARLLEKEGVENYMILIGGEVVVKGVNQNGVCWRTGINLPEDDPDGIKNNYDEIVQLCKKGAIATSGNYRNFYIKDGKKYAHTIDPRTGYPAEQSVLSATIVANDCMTADAYATAFMAMGLEKARQMADSLPEIEYYVIYADENGKHQIEYSKGMLQYLPKRKQ
mgnify:CR=1 FL=1